MATLRLSGSGCRVNDQAGAGGWRLRDASLRAVLARQDWGSILGTVVAVVALGVTTLVQGEPRPRPYYIYDATIAFPNNDSTVPYWAACLAGALACAVSVTAGELWLAARLHAGLTDALAATVHFIVDAISAFAVTGLATTVIKMEVGRLRPDFLDRCQPAVPAAVNVTYGLPASASPACTVPPSGDLTEGHYSFPSGHTSTVFVFALWAVGYCVWLLYVRLPQPSPAAVAARPAAERLLHDAATAAGFLWLLALLTYAWGVSCTRIIDDKHHPSDVAAGALLGTMLGLLFVARAICRLGRVSEGAAAAAAAAAGGSATGGSASPASDVGGDHAASLLHAGRVAHHSSDPRAIV